MADWTSGYSAAAGVAYTFGYYGELNPLRMRLAFLDEGLAFPDVRTACELGYGQGLTINVHAAASPVEWWGTDFTPSQARFAQDLASASGARAHLSEQAFDEFCARTDLPDFDFIALHGIWSWVSDDNRAVILDFIRRKLRPGGVVYVGYNCTPGSAPLVPMRELLALHASTQSAPGNGLLANVDAAVAFAERLLDVKPAYTSATDRMRLLRHADRQYLAHEYFGSIWAPTSFAQMASSLAAAKLEYACSAQYVDHIHSLNLTLEQQQLLAELGDAKFRETVRDFIVNARFRRDYWVKGARRLTVVEQRDLVRQQLLVLVRPRADVDGVVRGALGESTLPDAFLTPVLDAFSLAEGAAVSIGDLERTVAHRGLQLPQLMYVLIALAGAGHVQPAQASSANVKSTTAKLNAALLERARGSDDVAYLASAVTGGAVPVEHVEQLFLLARSRSQDAKAWAPFAWEALQQSDMHVMKHGMPLLSPEESVAELSSLAARFAERKLPLLVALGAVAA